MLSMPFTLSTDWSPINRCTEAADVHVPISNTCGEKIQFEVTTSDTLPVLAFTQGHPVMPSLGQPLQLKTGDRLWLAGAGSEATATLGVLMA